MVLRKEKVGRQLRRKALGTHSTSLEQALCYAIIL